MTQQLKGIIDYTNKEFVTVGKVSVSRHKDGSLRVIGGRSPNLKITGDTPINARYCIAEALPNGTVQVVSSKPMPSYADLRAVINRQVSLEVAKEVVDADYIMEESDEELECEYLIAVAKYLETKSK